MSLLFLICIFTWESGSTGVCHLLQNCYERVGVQGQRQGALARTLHAHAVMSFAKIVTSSRNLGIPATPIGILIKMSPFGIR